MSTIKSLSLEALSAAGRACGIGAKYLDLALRGDHALVLGWRQPDELVFVLEGSPAASAFARGVTHGQQVYGNREGAIHEVGSGSTLVALDRAPSAVREVVKSLAGVAPAAPAAPRATPAPSSPPIMPRAHVRPTPIRTPAPTPKKEGAIRAGFLAEQRKAEQAEEDPAAAWGDAMARESVMGGASRRSKQTPPRAAPRRTLSLIAQNARAAAERNFNEDEPPSAA
jgi:hypothetical protein